MPKREDIKTILIIGAGPIVIGQGCEFDYSGTQACKALKEEGYNVVLINSNPATIMTDPEFSDRTYIEPITPEAVEKIIEKEKDGPFHIDVLLPTLGGQTGLNCACQLFDSGVLDKHGVEMIGANREVIYRAEDRLQFKECMESIGLQCPKAGVAETMDEARAILDEVGLPAIIRPAFTLGGTGGGVAYNLEEFEDIAKRGLDASMNSQILIDQSLLGWKEYELEVMRDTEDNCVIICAIENFDPMGVHTGDSITVAPAQTLTDKEYQRMRDASLAIMRAIGVETGGSNVQFGVNPADGELVVIEMNPRVSRSSALASKATGFPIAKLAAKLAVGYTLWELDNDITGETKACFEPSIDYVVTKIPRWTFEKFPEADETLTTQMKSVGEAMSIGRTFKESLQKGIRSMEVKRFGLGLDANDKWLNSSRGLKNADDSPIEWPIDATKLERKLASPSQGRMYYLRYALKMGRTVDEVYQTTGIDPWFLDQLKQLIDFEDVLAGYKKLADVPRDVMMQAKQWGYSDPQLANLYEGSINTKNILKVREYRKGLGIEPVYKLVDTCAAEFEASTPYYYSAYEAPITQIDESGNAVVACDDEIRVSDRKKIIILGGGPNRIGQGIEFDYCCVQAAFAAKELGFEAVMVNSNPETVSTDYDTSDLLFFEPLTFEDVLNICERLNGGAFGSANSQNLVHGVIVSFGGQTPLNLAHSLERAGVPIIGTAVDSIDLAEDRERFAGLCDKLGVQQPANGIARNVEQAVEIANRISYPVLVRPSFVLGGRAMETVYDDDQLRRYMTIAIGASDLEGQPILVDKFLAEATECDIDVIADYAATDGNEDCRALVCGVLEHIEEAGIHSGDSACTIPPYSLAAPTIERLKQLSRDMAKALSVRGLMNVQWAIRKGESPEQDEIYVIEVNPRASRTVPFVGKATGVSWAKLAAKVMAGKQLSELGVTEEVTPVHTSIKESVFPFSKFPGVDVILGPEMRSTGECMGADHDYPTAFAKSQMSAGVSLPTEGKIFLSVRDSDKPHIEGLARDLVEMGFEVLTTGGTHTYLMDRGIETTRIRKISEGRPNATDLIKNQEIALIFNTPTRKGAGSDEGHLRATAVRFRTGMITTLTAATAAVQAMKALRESGWGVSALQDYFPEVARSVEG
ncbi:carbamoyl-phosphate synthase large subunit [Poriferisphaera sp. WC338]|uniref:carbamoyl-phosphate synthase large subunit n=1 Tax=Poriferisphaera sp. WC338 TaxID=3425129 RepID=UPI003D81A4A1